MTPDQRKWRDLSNLERGIMVTGSAIQLGLQGAALADLLKREEDEVRGRKKWWVAASFVNFVGPLAYFAFGRS